MRARLEEIHSSLRATQLWSFEAETSTQLSLHTYSFSHALGPWRFKAAFKASLHVLCLVLGSREAPSTQELPGWMFVSFVQAEEMAPWFIRLFSSLCAGHAFPGKGRSPLLTTDNFSFRLKHFSSCALKILMSYTLAQWGRESGQSCLLLYTPVPGPQKEVAFFNYSLDQHMNHGRNLKLMH